MIYLRTNMSVTNETIQKGYKTPKTQQEVNKYFGLLREIGDINVDQFMLMSYTEQDNVRLIAFKNMDTRRYIFIQEIIT